LTARATFVVRTRKKNDFAEVARYRSENNFVGPRQRSVMSNGCDKF